MKNETRAQAIQKYIKMHEAQYSVSALLIQTQTNFVAWWWFVIIYASKRSLATVVSHFNFYLFCAHKWMKQTTIYKKFFSLDSFRSFVRAFTKHNHPETRAHYAMNFNR